MTELVARYVRIRSWHIAGHIDGRTRCGRPIPIPGDWSVTEPLNEPSCEVCLRLDAHDREAR